MRQRGDFIVSKGRHTVPNRRLSHLVRLFGMLQGLPGMLVSALMFGFPLLFAGTVGVGSKVVQLRSPLMIFVVRSVVVSGGHS
jgi:hypothetical protein